MPAITIICGVLALIFGTIAIVCALYARKKYVKLQNEIENAKQETSAYEAREQQARNELDKCLLKKAQTEGELSALQFSIANMRDQADEAAEAYKKEKFENVEHELERLIQAEQDKYQQAKEDYEEDYLQVMREMSQQVASYGIKANELVQLIEDMQAKANAAVEINKRNMKDHDTLEFHRLQIPDSDLLEVEKLRSVIPYLRDKDALNKVIYKIYYENPTNDLIGRVVGTRQGGIYKITNINNGMCYVGQAVNFANRWKQHIKRGVGAEPITHNKLYPAMQKEGVHNFTFEIVEECAPNKMNEREQYWQNFFKAKEFGYSIR